MIKTYLLVARDWVILATGFLALPLVLTDNIDLTEIMLACILASIITAFLAGRRWMREMLLALAAMRWQAQDQDRNPTDGGDQEPPQDSDELHVVA